MEQLGKYQLIRKLATGGMAEVYLAKAAGPMGFEKTLVLKRILPHLAEDPAFVEMFLGEAKLAAQLNHPNIVQIFDFGEADGEYFLAMEYIDGPNLRVLLKRATSLGLSLPAPLCARLIASACEGLAFAHDFQDPATGELIGLIHRDISPDNILVSRQGAVKVVDFGIAKAAGQSHKTQSGVIKGKLAYMPAEQVRAKTLDRRVDVYALGVVLYELLTGHKPFEAPSDASLMQAILFEPSTPATQHRADLPEPLQRILERAMAKDCDQRYPDCLAFASDLEDFILSAGKPVTTQQLVQLVAQVTPSAEGVMLTPQSGTARKGSGSRPSATPVHTPAPVSSPTGAAPRSTLRPATTPAPAAPAPATKTAEKVAAQEPSAEGPPERTLALNVEAAPGEKPQEPAPASQTRKRLLPALAGIALLTAGGGLVLWRTGSSPQPSVPPAVVVASNPAPTLPEPKAPEPTAPEPKAAEPTPPEPAAPEPKAAEPTPPEPAVAVAPPVEQPAPVKLAVKTEERVRPTKPKVKPVAAAAAPVGKGTVVFRVRPYATVILSGKNLGQTPFDPIETPAGKYTVQFVNDDLKKKVSQTFELKAGETRVIKVNLEE